MDRVLRFKPHLRAEPVGEDQVFLIGEHERFLLEGRLQALVAPLIDGERTVLQIIEEVAAWASPPEVLYVVSIMEKSGYLMEVPLELAPETTAFWHALGFDADLVARRLAATPLRVIALGATRVHTLVEALTGAGVVVDEQADVRVVLVDDYLAPAVQAFHGRARAERLCWVPVKCIGSSMWLGPIFRPDRGACWACLAHRLRANRPLEHHVVYSRGDGGALPLAPHAWLPTSMKLASDLAAMVLARWVVESGEGTNVLDNNLLRFNVARLAVEEHSVGRRPQCAACGDASLVAKRMCAPVELQPRLRVQNDAGGYRCVDPAETFARYGKLISPITGVIASLGPLPGLDHPLRPVYGAVGFASPVTRTRIRATDFNRASMGKGRTGMQARTSALCEALEQYSSAWQGDESWIRAGVDELEGQAVHTHSLYNFSAAQYSRAASQEEARVDPAYWIARPLEGRQAIDWVPAWSLSAKRRRYLPATYCYRGARDPDDLAFATYEPNGHGAGNCLEEAILHGILELVERDAVSIWWYNRIRCPRVELSGFDQPYFCELESHYRELGFHLWVLDVTADIPIPVFVALAYSEARKRYCIGFGSHLAPHLGVQRALTELNQLLDTDSSRPSPWGCESVADASFLRPDEGVPPRCHDDFERPVSQRLDEDMSVCVERIAAFGLDVIVQDQTRPDIGLNAVKVVIPGLRHVWPRFGPGRLYDVPVAMGWQEETLTEEQLNPVALAL